MATTGIGTVGVASITDAVVSGAATFNNDVSVLGNLNVTGDLSYDEVTGRNFYITGISTLAGTVYGSTGLTAGNALVVGSGVSIAGITTLAGGGGITTTGGDFYVGGDAYIGGDLTFDEFTARNASITGIATAANFHIGAGGTVLNATNTGTFAIGSATTLATVTINGGSVPSIGLVIALGG